MLGVIDSRRNKEQGQLPASTRDGESWKKHRSHPYNKHQCWATCKWITFPGPSREQGQWGTKTPLEPCRPGTCCGTLTTRPWPKQLTDCSSVSQQENTEYIHRLCNTEHKGIHTHFQPFPGLPGVLTKEKGESRGSVLPPSSGGNLRHCRGGL